MTPFVHNFTSLVGHLIPDKMKKLGIKAVKMFNPQEQLFFTWVEYGKSVWNSRSCFDPLIRSSFQFLTYFDYIDNHNSFVIHQRITFMRFEVQFNKNIQVGRKYFAWFWHISICAFNCVSRFFFIHEFETLLPYRRREKQLLFRIKHFRTFFFLTVGQNNFGNKIPNSYL